MFYIIFKHTILRFQKRLFPDVATLLTCRHKRMVFKLVKGIYELCKGLPWGNGLFQKISIHPDKRHGNPAENAH